MLTIASSELILYINHGRFPQRAVLTSSSKFAASYTAEPWQKDLVEKITQFIRENISWIDTDLINSKPSPEESESTQSRSFRVLDYACGPGTVTNALNGHATEYLGVDLSQNMVNAYNTRFSTLNEGQSPNARAIVGNVLDEEIPDALPSPEFFNFDLVVVGLGFHHFKNLELATERLVERLKPGGVFFIIDFISHTKEHGPSMHTVAHLGFGEHQVQKVFGSAGLTDIGFIEMDGQVQIRSMSLRTPFLARGRKP
jgi:SAM-dependent methyltransferase